MSDWLPQHPPALFVLMSVPAVVGLLALLKLMSILSGWALLAQRFRLVGDFHGEIWRMQSAGFRRFWHYNNALTIGAGTKGLLIKATIISRFFHPPLLVPWSEISFAGKKKILFWEAVTLTLGREEKIPFTIFSGLAEKLKAAAGSSWPSEQMASGA